MTARRAFSLGLVLVSLLIGGKSLMPHAAAEEADEVATAAAFLPASAALEAYGAQTGSYGGAELSPTSPVRIVWAGETGYCLQGGAMYELGPGGVPQQGACPVAR